MVFKAYGLVGNGGMKGKRISMISNILSGKRGTDPYSRPMIQSPIAIRVIIPSPPYHEKVIVPL